MNERWLMQRMTRKPAWRILCYRVEIWKSWKLENPKSIQFPVIHAVVLYQGKKAWNAGGLFEELIDFGNLELEQPLDGQKVSSQYSVVSVMDLPTIGLNEILSKPGGNATFEVIIEYILVSEDDEKKVFDALKQTPPKIEKRAMSVAEKWEERGIEKGIEKARKDLIASMLKNGVSPEEISKITDLDLAAVKAIENERNAD